MPQTALILTHRCPGHCCEVAALGLDLTLSLSLSKGKMQEALQIRKFIHVCTLHKKA